ncbi:MAG: phosphatase PAP2 family protein [Microgenomates group bacterium]
MKISQWLKLQKEDLLKRFKTYSRIRVLFFFSLIFGFLVSLISLWQKIFDFSLIKLDQKVQDSLKMVSFPVLNSIFSFVTFLGSEIFIMVTSLILIAFLIQKRRKRAATVTLISLVGSAILISFFKSFFGRERPGECPNHLLGGNSSCFSFPSGHSTLAFYFYGLITYLIIRFGLLPAKKTWFVVGGAAVLVVLIAFSRLYLGLHFLSDVIGGFLLGEVWLTMAIFLIDFLY